MAYRELSVVEIRQVLRHWLAHKREGLRRIAEATGVDRKTVRRYVDAAFALGLTRDSAVTLLDDTLIGAVSAHVQVGTPGVRGGSWALCMTQRERLAQWHRDGTPGPKLVELLRRHSGQTVPLRTLQRFVAGELGGAGKPGTTERLADCAPGEELQVDYEELGWVIDPDTGKRRKLHAFVCVAVWSRHMFVYPSWNETLETTIDALEAAWAFFGGVFKVVIPDNLRVVVTKSDPVAPLLAEAFADYSQSRGFLVSPARVRRPQDKGRVERGVQFTQGDFFCGEQLAGLQPWREWGETWCRDRAGLRVHGTTGQRPREAFEQTEKQALLPAPTQPWDMPSWQDAKVGRDHRIQVKGAFYRLPTGHVGEKTRVRLDRTTVKVYKKNQLLRAYARVPLGQTGGDPEDIAPHLRALVQRDPEAFVARALALGEHVGEVAWRLITSGPWFGQARKVHRLLALCERFGTASADDACRQALALDVIDVVRIERMLALGLERLHTTTPPVPRLPKPRFLRDPETFRMRPHAPPGVSHAAANT